MTDRTDSDSSESVEDVIEIRPLPRRNILELQDIESESDQPTFRESNAPDLMQGTGGFRRTGRIHGKTQEFPNTTPRLYSDSSQQFPSVIPLNVGGVKYVTRLSTLCKYPDSMLAALFSGRHAVDKDQSGCYFLDSNGSMFGYILEFLRNGSTPPNHVSVAVYQDANYYGLSHLMEKLQLKPEVARLHVREAHRQQFPNYYQVKNQVIHLAIDNAILNRLGEVILYVFRTEFVPKVPNFNPNHGCVIENAHLTVGPWSAAVDEELFMKCLETDLIEEGFNLKPHESKKKCRYFHGQTCQKFVYRLQIMF
ncbi:BTB/POZ domain-containing protein KCTD7-like [Pecten maximus]|uniref:BTB/POZ domain-containing protein KCTD7-like n=1 Tax=Pecten maximus TaxID=6579 RepID=UPI001458DAC4|nr:BTB/POZ domain-containing protein KCTD7-like [Pecten maximus]